MTISCYPCLDIPAPIWPPLHTRQRLRPRPITPMNHFLPRRAHTKSRVASCSAARANPILKRKLTMASLYETSEYATTRSRFHLFFFFQRERKKNTLCHLALPQIAKDRPVPFSPSLLNMPMWIWDCPAPYDFLLIVHSPSSFSLCLE
jgi:hypothetical protein